MSSQLKIESNRRNSQKSTGPRTPAGKAASSLNHTKSGLYAKSQIIIGERQSDFEDLAADFTSRYLPDSPVAQSLLDIAVHSEWILRRLRRAETGIWDYFIDDHDYGADTTGLGRAFDCNDRTFARLQRRLDSLQRNFHRALKELDRLHSARPEPQAEPQPLPNPQPRPEPPAAAPPAGFGFESSPSPAPPPPPVHAAPSVQLTPPASRPPVPLPHSVLPTSRPRVSRVPPVNTAPSTSPPPFGFESSPAPAPAPALPLPPVTMEKPCP